MHIADIIDLDRYPIADLSAPAGQALLAQGRAELAAEGVTLMPGFIRPAAVAQMESDAVHNLKTGHYRERLRSRETGRASGCHPWRRDTRVAMRSAGGDRIAPESPLRRVYDWDPMTAFIGALLGHPAFHRTDTMVGCMLGEQEVGDELGWHYDPNDGVVTLMIRPAQAGGRFQFAPEVRRDNATEEEAHAIIDAVMDGHHPDIREADLKPGTLTVFQGKRSLHRVSPVEAGPSRLILILSYHTRPNYIFSEEIRLGFFGRLD